MNTNSVVLVSNGSLYSFQFGDTLFAVDANYGGRIVTFALSGQNILTGPAVDPANYGSTFWSSPQTAWNWPPPTAVDSAPHTPSLDGAALSLSGATVALRAALLGLAVEKKFSADSAAGVVTVAYNLANRGSQARRAAPWEITRFAASSLTFLPGGEGGRRKGQPNLLSPTIGNREAWFACDAAGVTQNEKLFADSREGWITDTERHLLWFVMAILFTHDLGLQLLRQTIKSEGYVVFPAQCTGRLRFPGEEGVGVAGGFAGSVKSIHTTLLAGELRHEAPKRTLSCPVCDVEMPVPDFRPAPAATSTVLAKKIYVSAKASRQRMTAKRVIKAKEAEGKYDVFMSHNVKDKVAVEEIARKLKSVGIRPWLDKWDLVPGENVMESLERSIETIKCGVLFFGPEDLGNWHAIEIRSYVESNAGLAARFIPVILPGVEGTPKLPIFVRQSLWVDMREWKQAKSDAFYRLACGILGKQPGDSPMTSLSARQVWEWQKRGRT